MSDRSTKSSTRSSSSTGKSNGKHSRGPVDAQLGDLEFSDWYEATVFEPSNEERFEAMATGGSAPARLLARAVIAAGAKRERIRGSRNGSTPTKEEKEELAELAELAPEPIENAVTEPDVAPTTEPDDTLTAEPDDTLTAEPDEPAIEHAEIPNDDQPFPDVPEPEPVILEPGAPEPLLIPELADRPSFKQRASALLDRWAIREVAIATKLDEALVPPSISWPSRKRPAHARRSKPD